MVLRIWLMSLFEPGSRRTLVSLQAHLAQYPQVYTMCVCVFVCVCACVCVCVCARVLV